jgi:hypothetical protein
MLMILIAQAKLCEFGDCLMPQVMKTQPVQRVSQYLDIRLAFLSLADILRLLNCAAVRTRNGAGQTPPCRAPVPHWFGSVEIPMLTGRHDVMLLLLGPSGQQAHLH